MSTPTLFERIVDGSVPSWKVWENDTHLAFLSPFGNTPGMTVVVPKVNPGDYIFGLPADEVHALIDAATIVAKKLEAALGVTRVAMVFEGEAVPHVHAKLYPMHGSDADRAAFPKLEGYFPQYPGYLTTIEGPKISDETLDTIQQRIREAEA